MKNFAKLALAIPFCLAGTALAQEKEKPVAKTPVPIKAVKAAAAPALDGDAADAVWKKAPAIKLNAIKGANFKGGQGKTDITLQAAYTADTLYLLLTYDDPTLSVKRSPYIKQADGSWVKAKDPDDKGGDNNKFYEDKFAFIWNINKSIAGFDEKFGCQIACHAGEQGKPYGNKYNDEEGELGDIWHYKHVRTGPVGQVDDGYLDHTRYDSDKNKNAGRKLDAKTGGGYEDVNLVNGKPEFMSKDGKPANKGGTYWIKAEDKVAFDDSKFKPGDEVASIVIAPFAGDRGEVKVAGKWKNGKWVYEIERKLVTGSKTDVQFNDLSKVYGFGVAVFDNAQVRHAYALEPLHLSFEK